MVKKEIEELYRKNYNRLINYFRKLNPGNYEAEDLIHQLFLNISKDKITNIHKISSYMFRAARNLITDILRSKNKYQTAKLPENKAIEETPQNIIEEKIEFEKIISSLKEDEKKIIRMKIIDNLTFKEISESLGMNLNTVISKFNRVIKKLSQRLKSNEE